MSQNQVRLLLSDEDEHTEWFRFRNVNKWIHKLWKPIFIGMYVGKYEGGWKNGKMFGQGTMNYLNGDVYIGEWLNSKRHGKGTTTYIDGGIDSGIWKRDKLRKRK